MSYIGTRPDIGAVVLTGMDAFFAGPELPLTRSGGLFLAIAGVSVLIGAHFFRVRYEIFFLGAVAAGTLTAMYAVSLSAPHGPPNLLQIVSLTVAVVVEMAFLAYALRPSQRQDDRHTMITILTIVGGHFALMTPAFGPLILGLAGASVLNTLVALVFKSYPSPVVWAVDGALKFAFGVLMLGDLEAVLAMLQKAP